MEKKIILKDPEDKLYKIGFLDGKEKTNTNLEKNLPADIKSLNPRGPQRYIEGFIAGNEEAIKEKNENINQPKTRFI